MDKDRTDIELDVLVVFTSFDIAGAPGRYIIVAASGSDAWILFHNDGKVQAEKIELNRPYPFADEAYSFSVNSLATGAAIKADWKSNSEKLLRPALAVAIESGEAQQKVILELNKPYHYNADSGTMILLYRRQVNSSEVTGLGQ